MTTAKIPFEREDRYIVIKLSHLHCADALISAANEVTLRNFLEAKEIIPVEAVVVEADWPEYETVWKMIEGRVTDRVLTNGQHEVDDYGPVGDAARRICSFCEGDMRRLVYITAKEELAAIEARCVA